MQTTLNPTPVHFFDTHLKKSCKSILLKSASRMIIKSIEHFDFGTYLNSIVEMMQLWNIVVTICFTCKLSKVLAKMNPVNQLHKQLKEMLFTFLYSLVCSKSQIWYNF